MQNSEARAYRKAKSGIEPDAGVKLLDAVMRLTGARSALVWSERGGALSSAGWEVAPDAVEAAGAALAGRTAVEIFPSGHESLMGADRSAPEECDRFLLLPIERGRLQMLLGLAKGAEIDPSLDLEAIATLAAAAFEPSLEPSFDFAQLATIREVVSGIAHDVGTPLNVISGYSEYLLMGGEDAPGRKELSTILDQTRRLAQMIHHMLDTVRTVPGESGRSRPLAAFVEESLLIAAYMLRKAQVKCTVEGAAPEHAMISGDLPLLYQTVFNLLAGAARAAGSSGRLVVRPVAGPETGTGVEIEAANAAGDPVDLAPLATGGTMTNPADRLVPVFVERALEAQGGGLVPVYEKEDGPARLLVRVCA